MDINLILGIVGVALSIVSFLYAIHVTRTSKREKSLVYEVLEVVPIAQIISGQGAYSLQLLYNRPGNEPLRIEHAFVQYIRLTNFGRVAIRKEDLASTDPLRIEISPSKGQVLDISLSGVTRETCNVSVGKPEINDSIVVAKIDFEFLDYLDGCLIQVLSDTPRIETRLLGTIVGMPEGIMVSPDTSDGTPVPAWGCVVFAVLELLSIAATAYLYRLIIGNWNSIWVLFLPAIPLFVPAIIFAIFMSLLGSRTGYKFPKRLIPP